MSAASRPVSTCHPATFILLWLGYAGAAQLASPPELALLCLPAVLLALCASAKRWFAMLRRTRWISLTLLFIYAWATPGEPWWPGLDIWSPTEEGSWEGLLQLLRLHAVLAALSILLASLNQQQLLSGLYTCAFPLHWAGGLRERLVVRLALTLRYAEEDIRGVRLRSLRDLQHLFDASRAQGGYVELVRHPWTWRDVMLLLLAPVLLWMIGS